MKINYTIAILLLACYLSVPECFGQNTTSTTTEPTTTTTETTTTTKETTTTTTTTTTEETTTTKEETTTTEQHNTTETRTSTTTTEPITTLTSKASTTPGYVKQSTFITTVIVLFILVALLASGMVYMFIKLRGQNGYTSFNR